MSNYLKSFPAIGVGLLFVAVAAYAGNVINSPAPPAPRIVSQPEVRPVSQPPPQKPRVEYLMRGRNTGINAKLARIVDELSNEVKTADALTARLHKVASEQPADMQREVNTVGDWMGRAADKLGRRGEITIEIKALERSARAQRDRIAADKGMLEPSDQRKLLQVWNHVLEECSNAEAAVSNMHTELLGVLGSLRKRELAISEFMLAGQYEDAIASLNAWLVNMNSTISTMKATISQFHASVAAQASS